MSKTPRKPGDEPFGEFPAGDPEERESGNDLENYFKGTVKVEKQPASDDGFVAAVSSAARKFLEKAKLRKASSDVPPGDAVSGENRGSDSGSDLRNESREGAEITAGLSGKSSHEPVSDVNELGIDWASSAPGIPSLAEPGPRRKDQDRPPRKAPRESAVQGAGQTGDSPQRSKPASEPSPWDSLASELGIAPAPQAREKTAPGPDAPDLSESRSEESSGSRQGRRDVRREHPGRRDQRRETGDARGSKSGPAPDSRRAGPPDSPPAKSKSPSSSSFGAGLLSEEPSFANEKEDEDLPAARRSQEKEFEPEVEVDDSETAPMEEAAPVAGSSSWDDDYVEFDVEDLDPGHRREPKRQRETAEEPRPSRRHRPARDEQRDSREAPRREPEKEKESIEPAGDSLAAGETREGEGDETRPRSRRRRSRGRGRRNREVSRAAGEAEPLASDLGDAREPDEEPAVARPAGDSRRGSRRRRPESEPRKEPASGPRAVNDDDDFLEDDGGDDRATAKPKNLPTWNETVDVIVQANIASRKRAPQRRRGGGGGRSGGGPPHQR